MVSILITLYNTYIYALTRVIFFFLKHYKKHAFYLTVDLAIATNDGFSDG